MGESPPRWTPDRVMAELRAAMARPVIYPRIRMGPDDAMPALDMIALTERYLGRQSRDRSAMLVLAKPPGSMSIREWCKEFGRSRASLYRWAGRGKRAVVRRLEEDGVVVPEGRSEQNSNTRRNVR